MSSEAELFDIGELVRIKVTGQIGQVIGHVYLRFERMLIVRTPTLLTVQLHPMELAKIDQNVSEETMFKN